MLKQRVITALILAPLVIWSVLTLENLYFGWLLGGVLLVAGDEWARLSGAAGWLERGSFLLILALSMVLLAYLTSVHAEILIWLLAANLLWWLVVLFRLGRFKAEIRLREMNPYQLIAGLVVLVPAWLAMLTLHRLPAVGPGLLVFLFLLIWIADIAAYFTGRRWGHRKLAPQVSPGKTREGVYGALTGALLCGVSLAWWQDWAPSIYPLAALLCLFTVLVSVLGDLFVSMLKRERGVKDSSALLPGHGGLLDRIDSLTAASPLFLFGLIMLGKTT
jgi:phosphatidate cytidylyltransferase